MSREVVETAKAKAAADQAALMLARRKAEAAFGRNAPWQRRRPRRDHGAAGLRQKRAGARHLPAGRTGQRDAAPAADHTAGRGRAKSWTTSTIWEAPADPAFPGRGFYALVDGSDLAQNEHVTADGAGRRGRGRRDGARRRAGLWRERGLGLCPDRSRAISCAPPSIPARPLGDGYFVPDGGGIRAGQDIVTSGAGLLLARELNPSTEAEE